MRYLDASFTIYPAVRSASKVTRTPQVKKISPKHQFVAVNGMCKFCALSREGHREKYGKPSTESE